MTKDTNGHEEMEVVWSGEPIRLHRDWGGTFWRGHLDTLQLPGRHLHPARREAALEILNAQAKLKELRETLAGREAQKAQLYEQQTATAAELVEFNATTELIQMRDIPRAEAAERDAWLIWSGTYYRTIAEQVEYVQKRRQGAVEAAQRSADALLRDLSELRLLNDLQDGVGLHEPDQSDQNVRQAAFNRSERGQSIARIAVGHQLEGFQGRQLGVLDLISEYERALTPEPPPEMVPEPEPATTSPYERNDGYEARKSVDPGLQSAS
jgi:hypothetical protein